MNNILTPLTLKSLTINNRVVMPPMCMYCASENNTPTQWHVIHYATRAIGGIGLVFVEASGVAPEGRISSNDVGLYRDDQGDALKAVVSAVHENGGKIGIQLSHSGRKCEAPDVTIEAPSALAYDEKSRIPKEMSIEDIAETVLEFRRAAKRANDADFDIIEIHAAHGYLINQFLSPLTNKRTDFYGGTPENRCRFLGEVLEAVSAVWPSEKPICVRVTAEDYMEGGNRPEDLAEMLNLVKSKGNGIDIVDVSTGGLVPVLPKVFPGYQLPHAKIIKEKTGLPVIGGGLITTQEQANNAIRESGMDAVYLGRELLRNPYWLMQASLEMEAELPWPKQYERAKPKK